ncbi:MAG: hypothetical protein KJ550_05050 [Proteobacteria bacterium]|nr:hypothetical protein [Pseudomonadota bacterium]MBU4012814.1 hypothetical protein [Pseudomonadota bacterium]MBU4068245.1 hypothetical protein [Pseudomonadota bacterium]MBU4126997.1 hypothetical protein [Pseudomonadota bacterium]
MKLEKILDTLNSFEKNAFLKIIDSIIANKPKNTIEIEKILSDKSKELKNIDNLNVAKVFILVEDEFAKYVRKEFVNTTSQIDILTDIIIKDGNCIMKRDWLARLYENELKAVDKKLNVFQKIFDNDNPGIEERRIRDYKIYRACLHTAYTNDLEANQDAKITSDEQSIILTLSKHLELSQEEIKLINHIIVPFKKLDIDTVINTLKNIGIVFYSKKNSTVYVADEVVRILRKVRGKEVADKFFRRVLRYLREPQVNLICKKHNIDWRLPLEQKIKGIIKEGISFSGILINDIFKEETKISEKKKFINNLCDKELKISPSLKGATVEEKISNLIRYFEDVEQDEKVGISIDGYEKLLIEIGEILPKLNEQLKDEFELQDETVLKSSYLLDYNIKPRDVLEIISENDLDIFCKSKNIKTRGDLITNILDTYQDAENLYLENYEHIGFRNLNVLKENGIRIKESKLGIKFEDLTKSIFTKLGLNVDEKLRQLLNTKKEKIDIVINLDNRELILIECKTIKDSGYNKFSSVSRQLKAYINLAISKEFKVIKSLLIAPDFSDDFVKDCGLDYELNLSLITASSLINILNGFRNSKHKQFPYNLLMRDVLIQEDRILKAIEK